MNAAELHLALNHVPILGTLFGFLLLLYGRGRNSEPVVRAALWTLGLAGAAAVGVYFTGEPAERLVEDLARTSGTALEAHEEMALWAAVGGGVLGSVALFGVLTYRSVSVSHRFANGVAVLSLGVVGVLLYTAYLGGRVRHPELRPDFAPAAAYEEADREEATDAEDVDSPVGEAATGAGRVAIELPPAGREQVLAEMRTMLRAVNGFLTYAAEGDRGGMREAALSGGTRIAVDMDTALMRRLSEEFVQLGMSTHRDFDGVAAALEAGVGRDSALALMGRLTDKCVACHASYRLTTHGETR